MQRSGPDPVSRTNSREIHALRMQKETSPLSPCVESACEMLRFSRNERKNYRVTFISGGKSRPTSAHKFTNHARLSVKFTRHIIILVLIIHVIIFSNVIGAALATLCFH